MRFSALCIVTYGVVKIYAVQVDSHNSHKLINLTQKFAALGYLTSFPDFSACNNLLKNACESNAI